MEIRVTTLFDRPISGQISHYSSKDIKEQHSPEQFRDALDAVLNIPGVEAVKWEQYTPYFNDGEACEFGWDEGPRVRVAGDDEEAGEYSDGYRTEFVEVHYNPKAPVGSSERWTETPVVIEGVDTDAITKALNDLAKEFAHQEVLLRKTFGDPAEVTATKAGFEVEHYDHD